MIGKNLVRRRASWIEDSVGLNQAAFAFAKMAEDPGLPLDNKLAGVRTVQPGRHILKRPGAKQRLDTAVAQLLRAMFMPEISRMDKQVLLTNAVAVPSHL